MSFHIPHWRLRRQLTSATLPASLRHWLFETGSLTRKLRGHCRQGFGLELLGQSRRSLMRDEGTALGIAARHLAIVRQVRLFCDGQPMVFARSVIPLNSLTGDARRLDGLGARPLADLLFSDRRTQRTAMEFTRLKKSHRLYKLAASALDIGHEPWARRTLFRFADQPLLVCEVFSPNLTR